ncbi:peptidoglycan-binding domain-containing protein [Streptomyces cellulosae]|uniref:Peptidoglycan-binding protein n=1 Tax=Streptomyces cellulosae TaxID=1968 RepID=A0ABW7XZE6_STRCE
MARLRPCRVRPDLTAVLLVASALALGPAAAPALGAPGADTRTSAYAEPAECRPGGPVSHPSGFNPGDSGSAVSHLQCLLDRLGYTVPATGHYDTRTAQAVRQFFADQGLPYDGILGPSFWTRLHR